MKNFITSCICVSALLVGHIGFAMEPCTAQQKQQNEEIILRKKIAEFNVPCPVTQEILLPDELQLNIASDMMQDFLWNTVTDLRESQQVGDSSHGKLLCAEISHNDKQLITVDEAKKNVAYLWNMATAQLEHTLNDHEGAISSVMFSPNDEQVITEADDGEVKIWHRETGTLEYTLPMLFGHISLMAVSPDNSCLVTVSSHAGAHTLVQSWNMATGELMAVMEGEDHCITSIVVRPGWYQLLTISCHALLRLWDMETGRLLRTFAQGKAEKHGCFDTVITSDGNYVIVGLDTQIRLWDMQTDQAFAFEAHEKSIKGLCISLDTTKLVTMAFDGIIKVWDIADWSLLHTFESGHITCLPGLCAFDGYGKKFLKALANNSVQVSDIETGASCYLQGHRDAVGILKMNSDGSQMVTGSSAKVAKDKTTKIWSMKKSPARLWLENEILPFHANLITRIYAANKASRNFTIYSGTDDMLLWVSLPNYVRDYLNLYLQIELLLRSVQIH